MESQIIDMISNQLGQQIVQLTDELVDDLGADSLDVIELVMKIEEEFNIDLPYDAHNECLTVQDVVNLVRDHGGRVH